MKEKAKKSAKRINAGKGLVQMVEKTRQFQGEKLLPQPYDVNPCNYFLWGNLKTTNFNSLPNTIDELKANIERDCNKITSDIFKPVFI